MTDLKLNGNDMGDKETDLEDFKPKGAMAFFVVLIILFTLMWLSIYFEILGGV